jgi:hypothetical protein
MSSPSSPHVPTRLRGRPGCVAPPEAVAPVPTTPSPSMATAGRRQTSPSLGDGGKKAHTRQQLGNIILGGSKMESGIATHSSIFRRRRARTEEPREDSSSWMMRPPTRPGAGAIGMAPSAGVRTTVSARLTLLRLEDGRLGKMVHMRRRSVAVLASVSSMCRPCPHARRRGSCSRRVGM